MGLLDPPSISKVQADSLYQAKQAGKGLSTNDYDNTEKANLATVYNTAIQYVLGSNKFNYLDVDVDEYKYLFSNSAELSSGTNHLCITGFIPITSGAQLTINKIGSGGAFHCFFTSSKTFISSIAVTTSGSKQTVTGVANSAYVRLCFTLPNNVLLADGQVMVNDGATALAYEAYGLVPQLKPTTVADGFVTTAKYADASVTEVKLDALTKAQLYKPSLVLPVTFYAVVGDTFQLFFKSIVRNLQDYFLSVDCAKGRSYPRYFEYTPVTADIGTTTLIFTLLDMAGNTLATKTVSLVTKAASNPSSAKNILCVGDSTMQNGEIPIELSRRLKGTVGVATTPTALALPNWNVVGRLPNSNGTVKWEGTGGWVWESYTSSGTPAIRFGVTGITGLNIGDIYRIPRTINTVSDPTTYWQFQVQEINVTGSTGNVRAIFSATGYHVDFASEPQTGTWTKNSGSGQASVSYTSLAIENYQPFWNNTTNAMDFTTYVNTYCGGQLDYCYVKLGVNNLIGWTPWQDVTWVITNAKVFINSLHAAYPNCKVLIDSGELPSQKGGVSKDYNSSSPSGKYGAFGFNLKVWSLVEAYMALCVDPTYSSYVQFVSSYAQFDADNAYPTLTRAINTRVSTTETLDSNGVHPANAGYWQIADALFRHIA